jgi:hypothetical protein
MKNASPSKRKSTSKDELRPEYRFDYSKAKPNRFARRILSSGLPVLLDPDVAKFFKTAEAVNTALRALMTALPRGRALRDSVR